MGSSAMFDPVAKYGWPGQGEWKTASLESLVRARDTCEEVAVAWASGWKRARVVSVTTALDKLVEVLLELVDSRGMLAVDASLARKSVMVREPAKRRPGRVLKRVGDPPDKNPNIDPKDEELR